MCTSINAFAIEWVNYHNSEKASSFLDVDSVSEAGKIKKAWTKENLKVTTTLADGKQFNQLIILDYVDCFNDTKATKAVMFYLNDEYAAQLPQINELNFEIVSPGTPGYEKLKAICEYRR